MGFEARPLKGKKSRKFRIVMELYNPRRVETLPVDKYHFHGFNPDMTFEQAQERAKSLNKQNKFEKSKKIKATLNLVSKMLSHEIYLPDGLTRKFESELSKQYADNSSRLDTVLKHWNAAKKLILKIESTPNDFHKNRFEIYNYFKEMTWSPDYMKRITKILNQWGDSFCRDLGFHYMQIPRISGSWKEKVLEQRETIAVRRPAKALTLELLLSVKQKFESEDLLRQWNWLLISFVFGLRPSETDKLCEETHTKIEHLEHEKINVIRIYQNKLQSMQKKLRWKAIPIVSDEQIEAHKLIEQKSFKRPLVKTLNRLLGEGYDTYSPRKGFTDYMLKNDWELQDISAFLGHTSIETTWRHYKDKNQFKLPTRYKTTA